MRKIGYSLIDKSGNEVAHARDLPWNPPPPGRPKGRLATFTEVGQEADGFRVVERWETVPVHEYQLSGAGKTTYDGKNIVIDRQWTYPSLDEVKRLRIKEIKAGAAAAILERFPDWKQANMTARAVELQDLWRRNGGWTPGEKAEADALNAAWDWIKSVRAYSDDLEREVMALTTVDDVCRWYIPGWPT